MTALALDPPQLALRSQPWARRGGRVGTMHPTTRSAELADVLARVAGGDQAAFAQFYDLTSRTVFGIILSVLRDRAQAEEVTQEVYVEAWKLAPRFDVQQGSALAWLNTMARRRAVDRVRSAERSSAREIRHVEAERPPVGIDTSDIVIANDESRRVRNAMQSLPEVQRTALELAYFEGRTHSDIARHLEVPLGTVKTRIRDAMKRLRSQLGETSA
jgi:RNA polymerase sigma-70 factor (ECF subfamily)